MPRPLKKIFPISSLSLCLCVSVFFLFVSIARPSNSAEAGRVSFGALARFDYVYRAADDGAGVGGLSTFGASWIEFDIRGDLGDAGDGWIEYAIELVANNGAYPDPITGRGGVRAGAAGPGELGPIGVRRAQIILNNLIPSAVFELGAIIPDWGAFQERATSQWEFADLPLMYSDPAFRGVGWQNAGIGVTVVPADGIEVHAFYLNGYFPGGLANAEPVAAGGELDRGKALGGRLTLIAGPVRLFGGYLEESWDEDVRGGPGAEKQVARAWVAGAEIGSARLWAILEWTEVIIEEYQLRQDGRFDPLTAKGAHLSLGWRALDELHALVRLEWIDPNAANSRKTFVNSEYDQVTQWTLGVNLLLSPAAVVKVNYVIPVEEGKKIDVDAGKVGGKFQSRENNYLKVQFQVSR